MFEVATDYAMVVAGGSSNSQSDIGRLPPLLEEAKKNDPTPISQVLADSG